MVVNIGVPLAMQCVIAHFGNLAIIFNQNVARGRHVCIRPANFSKDCEQDLMYHIKAYS